MPSALHKIRLTRRRISIAAALAALVLIAAVISYVVRLNRSLALQQERQADAARVQVEERSLRAPSSDGLTLYLNAADVRAVASFEGARYFATSGGLVAIDDGGNIKRRYTTLDGLPENDLTALAVFRNRLFAGTASAGLVAFDGSAFTGYSFNKPKATHVTVLVPTETELLIGTLDGGLFEYNGERFSRRVNSATGADFNRVTSLLPFSSRLYIGTQDSGLYIWREAHIEHVTTNDGLPSPHVTAIAETPSGFSGGASVAVATDFGVVALNEGNEIKPISSRPNVTSLAVSDSHLWAGLFSGGIIDINASQIRQAADAAGPRANLSEAAGLPASPSTVCLTDGTLWVLSYEGAFARDEQATHPMFEPVASALARDCILTAGHITTLANDDAGRLWIGYFDRGIDLVSPDAAERVSHIEDDRVREINHLAFDRSENKMLAATSRGVVGFVEGVSKQTVLTREQGGLISDSVAHITFANIGSPLAASTVTSAGLEARGGQTTVLVTAGGLTEVTGGRARSITAFHGLASNHLYTSAVVGSRIFVGSLAGLVELEGLRVIRTYKTSNSRLSHDWVTALAEAEGTLYVGTNGGGVDALLPTGEWANFADELGKFEVNQNAMHYDGERLYVGTSDRGLLVYNTRDRRWTRVSAGLASQNVTAITSDDRFVYVGTLNGLVRIEKRIIQ
jgi:ligand-binding sensor domain-containing protein